MRKILGLLAFFLAVNCAAANAQVNYKAKFINAFTRYMEWPKASTGFFNVGVYGSFDLYKEISKETMGKTVGHQNVVAVNIFKESQLNLTDLHILVVGQKYCSPEHLKSIIAQFSNSFTLIVTEQNGIPYGAGISFKGDGRSLGYYYKPENIKPKGIFLSKQFELMGERID